MPREDDPRPDPTRGVHDPTPLQPGASNPSPQHSREWADVVEHLRIHLGVPHQLVQGLGIGHTQADGRVNPWQELGIFVVVRVEKTLEQLLGARGVRVCQVRQDCGILGGRHLIARGVRVRVRISVMVRVRVRISVMVSVRVRVRVKG